MKKLNFNNITPCGGCCDDCQYFKNAECIGCRDNGGKCVKLWSNGCEIYNCCSKHNVLFCGLCNEFPCKWINSKISEWNPQGVEELTELATRYRREKGL